MVNATLHMLPYHVHYPPDNNYGDTCHMSTCLDPHDVNSHIRHDDEDMSRYFADNIHPEGPGQTDHYGEKSIYVKISVLIRIVLR